jgi:hypothetical protein
MAVPANVGPPKTIVFRYSGLEKKLRDQFVYQAYASIAEVTKQKFISGNRLVLKFNEEVIGEGQIILVEKVTLASLTAYDAIVGGYESVDTLRKDAWKAIVGDVKKPEEVEFFRILFRWL